MTKNLLGLRVDNFKRITLVDIDFDPAGGVFAVSGANEAGKSSLLDALEAAIAGAKGPKMVAPVHAGAESARVIARFDDITVTRTYKLDGSTAIEVKDAEGRRMGNPSDLLKALYSHVALDPLAFSRLNDAEQVSTLLPIIGFDPAPLQAEHDAAYSLRTDVNRDLKALEARVAAFPDPKPGLPAKELSVLELTADVEKAIEVNTQREKIEQAILDREARLARIAEAITDHEATIASLRVEADGVGAAQAEARTLLATVVSVDVEPLRAAIQDAETTNALVRAQVERATVDALRVAAQKHVDDLTATIDRTKTDRKAALEAAKMPVPGLTVADDGGTLLLNGTPFSQASTGVKIRTGTAIAMTLNPDLRVIVIRDASLLDDGNRAVIDELARANGFLVLCEFADTDAPHGVVIEDGTVAEVRS